MAGVFVALLCLYSGTPASMEEVNLALKKNASMSTTEPGYPASNAVDGNTAQTLISGSCSSTKGDSWDPDDWWKVDLGGLYNISTITIYFRDEGPFGDVPPGSFSGFEVVVTSEFYPMFQVFPCYSERECSKQPSYPNSIVVLSSCNKAGRYVTIQRTRFDECLQMESSLPTLEICEVEVYEGEPAINVSTWGNFESNSKCDPLTGQCTEGDPAGITGELCTGVNLALKKNASMSTTEPGYPASKAVDGNTAQTLISGSCSSTKGDSWHPDDWWKVDLGGLYNISRITIYFRDEGPFGEVPPGSFPGFEVFVTSEPFPQSENLPCYSEKECSNRPPYPSSIVSLNSCNGTGRYVTIQRTRSDECLSFETNAPILEICEVEVCDYSGRSTEPTENVTTCVDCKLNSSCDTDSGICNESCSAGFTGELCTEECQNGTYGVGCNSTCGHCLQNTTCDRVNGHCTKGCSNGWDGHLCDKECYDGTFGVGCNSTCGHCLQNMTCDYINGTCPKGCSKGWDGHLCDRKCYDGTFGVGCNSTCGHCLQNMTCDHINGTCPKGCSKGWDGHLCDRKCRVGAYGSECSSTCGHCLQNMACDQVNGTCPKGCSNGWDGPLCDKKCKDGSYGPGCSQTCACGSDSVCDHVDGACTRQEEGKCEDIARRVPHFEMRFYMKNHIPSVVNKNYHQSSRDDLERCKLLCLALDFCEVIAVKHVEKGRDCMIYGHSTLNQPFMVSTDYDVYLKKEY